MNIFFREMKAHTKSLIFWSLGMLFMIISGMGKFSYYADSGQSLTDLISTMPKTLKSILGCVYGFPAASPAACPYACWAGGSMNFTGGRSASIILCSCNRSFSFIIRIYIINIYQ